MAAGRVWSPELQQVCRTALPHARISVSVGYGLTESPGLATSAADDVLRAHPDSVGHPLPDRQACASSDDDGAELARRRGRQHLLVRADGRPCPATGTTPKPPRNTIRDGWLRTGDYGYRRDGLLFLVSRRSDLIIRGGENIYPTEIEQRLDAHPAVAESAVVGVEHRELGQEVKAVVVITDERPAADLIPELESWVSDTLADIKVPAHWELRTEPLPRNATGKILKQVVQGDADYDFIEE